MWKKLRTTGQSMYGYIGLHGMAILYEVGITKGRNLLYPVSKVSEAAESFLTSLAGYWRLSKASPLRRQGIGGCRKLPDIVSKVSEVAESFLTPSASYRK